MRDMILILSGFCAGVCVAGFRALVILERGRMYCLWFVVGVMTGWFSMGVVAVFKSEGFIPWRRRRRNGL